MTLAQKRQELRQKQVERVKKFRQSNLSSSDASRDAAKKQKDREEMKREIKQELSQESTGIENSDGVTFARVIDIIGPTHMRPVVSDGVWKGTEQISEKKSECDCDCGEDPCVKCGKSHHSVKEAKVEANRSDYGKASVRNKRKFGKEGEPAIFDTNSERGKMIDQRRAEHKAKRGVKEQLEKDNSGPGTENQQDKQIDAKQKKADQIKKQVLLKKIQAVRQGAGSEIMASYDWRSDDSMRINKIFEGKKKGLWDNIHAKRKRGEKPAKPGDKDYPKTLDVE